MVGSVSGVLIMAASHGAHNKVSSIIGTRRVN